jgi:peroxiredoxin
MTVSVGDPLPDIMLLDPSGAATSLSAFAGEHTLLIFLRHLA